MAPKIPSKKKARRVALSRDSILDAAAALIDRVGYAQFSMRGLGTELGVEAMSVYHHFPSKAHIGDALLARLLESIPPIDATLPWPDKVRHVAHAHRAAILRHPGFATFAITHRMNTPEGLRYLEQIMAGIVQAGFSNEHTARVFRSLSYYLTGALLDETSGYAAGPSAADPLSLEEQQAIAPSVLAVASWFQPDNWEAMFDFGLEALLEYFERLPRTNP